MGGTIPVAPAHPVNRVQGSTLCMAPWVLRMPNVTWNS